MIVVLDNIRSTHNVGSIFRTADGAGFKKVILCGITPTPLDRFKRESLKIKKVALGAEKIVPWESYQRTSEVTEKLKKEGYKIFAVEQSKNSINYKDIKFSKEEAEKVALVLGSETSGLSDEILGRVDGVLEIPMKGKKESLNVAVVFGIVAFNYLYEIT